MMLIVPFIASLIVVIFYAFNFGETIELNDELSASFNGYIDWDNSIYMISMSNQVGKFYFRKYVCDY
jgi:hypothetical protein